MAVDHEIAAGGETIQTGLEGVFADAVVHDMDAATSGDAAGFFGDIGLRGHDDFVGARFGDGAGFFGGGSDTDYAGSAKLAIWQSNSPMPPAAACMRHQSPGLMG